LVVCYEQEKEEMAVQRDESHVLPEVTGTNKKRTFSGCPRLRESHKWFRGGRRPTGRKINIHSEGDWASSHRLPQEEEFKKVPIEIRASEE